AGFMPFKKGCHFPQISGPDAYIAVALYQQLIPGFTRQQRHVAYLAIRAKLRSARQQPNRPLRKFVHQPTHMSNGFVAQVVHTKQNFVFRIVLQTETLKIFVGSKIHAVDGFKNADGRRVGAQPLWTFTNKKSNRREDRNQIIDEWTERKKIDQSPPGWNAG